MPSSDCIPVPPHQACRLPTFVMQVDRGGRVRRVALSPGASRLLGLRQEPHAQELLARIPLQQRIQFEMALLDAPSGRGHVCDVQVETADGLRWTHFAWDAEPTADGARCAGVLLDATEHVAVEATAAIIAERIRLQNEILAAIALDPAMVAGEVERLAARITEAVADAFGISRVGVWLFDDGGRELRCVDLYEQAGGRHSGGAVLHEDAFREEFAHLRRAKFVSADDPLSDPRTAGYVEGYLKPMRITAMLDGVIRLDGRSIGTLCFEHVARPHRWSADEIAFNCQLCDQIGLAISNRERRRAEEARLAAERNLLEMQKLESLGVLAGGFAHDFNNLLGVILGNAELARRRLPADAGALAQLASIETASQRAADLCRQILAYAGKGRVASGRIDVSALVGEMAELLGSSIAKTAILRIDLASGLPPVEGDPTQIRQVVMNLITNASDALGGRPGTLRVTTALQTIGAVRRLDPLPGQHALPDGAYVEIVVSDTGCGMDAATQARIFDPFFTTKPTGRGLGLAAVQGIVRSHRGSIGIRSTAGAGTTFRILLPAAASPAAAGPQGPAAGAAPLRGTVLLVDDDESLRSLVSEMLRELGLQVVLAGDGQQAIDLYRRSAGGIDLVLLDLAMPRMGGIDAMRGLRLADPRARVLIASGYSDVAIPADETCRPDGFLQKPYTMDGLRTAIRAVLPPRR